ncbi:MAG TPA: ABC-2 family transporter protein, partial [Thermomicrobiales bacterium]|nr:ABC-2 family transporter protein [Thermomicrobiales bacterium]
MDALFDRPIDDSGWARLRRHGRLWRRFLMLAVVREAQFRAHFVATVVVGLAQVVVALIPILLIFNFTSAVHGWSQADLIVLLGIHQLVSALLAIAIAPNVTRMTEYITHGDLDLMLIRPVDAQFYVTFRWLQPAEAFNVAIGIGLVVVGLARAGEMPGLVAIGQGVLLLLCGVILLTCAWSAIAFCIFWVSSLHLGMTIFYDVMDAGRYPVVFYP